MPNNNTTKPKSPKPTKNPVNRASQTAKISFVIAIIGLVIAAIAIVMAFYVGTQLRSDDTQALSAIQKINTKALRERIQMQANLQALQARLNQQQQSLVGLQNNLAQVQQVSIQQGEHRQLSQISYLIHLANLHLTLNHDAQMAQKILTLADNRLQTLSSPMLLTLKQAIANDLTQLQSASHINREQLLIKLDQLRKTIMLSPDLRSIKKIDIKTPIAPKPQPDLPWYKRYWEQLAGLKNFIIIRHTRKAVLPLLTPKQQLYIKENIQVKLLQAEWAVLHRAPQVYRNSLNTVKSWIATYFPPSDSKDSLIAQTEQLLKVDIAPKLPAIGNSLDAIEKLLNANVLSTPKPKPSAKPQKKQPDSALLNQGATA